jgi:hypothetical protein
MNAKQFKFRYFDMVIRDIMGAIEGGALMGAATLSMLAIDYLAYHNYLVREQQKGHLPDPSKASQNSDDFKSLIGEYFTRLSYNKTANDLADCIWATRCSLVHVYGTAKAAHKANNLRFSFSHQHYRDTHLEVCKVEGNPSKTRIKYHLPTWIAEVIILADLYLDGLEPDSKAFERWNEEFMAIFYSDSTTTIPVRDHLGYKSIHPFLSILDVHEKPAPPILVGILSELIFTRLNPVAG